MPQNIQMNLYRREDILNLLDPVPVIQQLESLGYSKELMLSESGKDEWIEYQLNYYKNNDTIKVIWFKEEYKGSCEWYYFDNDDAKQFFNSFS